MTAKVLLCILSCVAPAFAATPLEILEGCQRRVTRIQRFVNPLYLGARIHKWVDPAPGGTPTPEAVRHCERWNRLLRTGQWLHAVSPCGATTTPAPVFRVEVRDHRYVTICSAHGDARALRYRILDATPPVPAAASTKACALNLKSLGGAVEMYGFDAGIDVARSEQSPRARQALEKLRTDWWPTLEAGGYLREELVCPGAPAKCPTYAISIGAGAWIIRCTVHGDGASAPPAPVARPRQ